MRSEGNYKIGLPAPNDGSVGDVIGVSYLGRNLLCIKFPEGWMYTEVKSLSKLPDIRLDAGEFMKIKGKSNRSVLEISEGGIIDFKGVMGSSTKNPESDTEDDWVEIKIAGTTYYLPAYTAS